MKIFTNQCPLCEEKLEQVMASNVYPRPCMCTLCGGTVMLLAEGQRRVMTRAERLELQEKFPVLPAIVKEAHDKAVADKWG